MKPIASCAELELALHQLVASLKGQLGFGELGLLLPNPLQLSPFAQDREIRGGVSGRVWPGSRCCMRPNSHGSLSRVNHLEHAGRDQPGGHIRVVVVVGGEAQLPRRRLPCTVGRVPPGREVLHRDKALIRQCRLDEPRDALEAMRFLAVLWSLATASVYTPGTSCGGATNSSGVTAMVWVALRSTGLGGLHLPLLGHRRERGHSVGQGGGRPPGN